MFLNSKRKRITYDAIILLIFSQSYSADFTILPLLSNGSAHIEIAWGFVVLLIGFIVVFGSAMRIQTIFTPLTATLVTIGSTILVLT